MIQLIRGFHDILPGRYCQMGIHRRFRQKGPGKVRIPRDRPTHHGTDRTFRTRHRAGYRHRGKGNVHVHGSRWRIAQSQARGHGRHPQGSGGTLASEARSSSEALHRRTYVQARTPLKRAIQAVLPINAEVLGDDSPATDADIISAAYAIMTAIGATGLIMEINSVGCQTCRATYRTKLRDYYAKYLSELCLIARGDTIRTRFGCWIAKCRVV